MNRHHDDKPTHGVQYRLTGGTGTPCIANGNTWEESKVDGGKDEARIQALEDKGLTRGDAQGVVMAEDLRAERAENDEQRRELERVDQLRAKARGIVEREHKSCAHCGDIYWVETTTLGDWAKHICTACASKILKSRISKEGK